MSEMIEDEVREPTLTYVAKLEARIEALVKALEKSDDLGKYWQARAIKAENIPAALAPEQDK